MEMVPGTTLRSKNFRAGIGGNERVVVYDDGSLLSSLLFVALERIGHRNVAILDRAWKTGRKPATYRRR